MPRSSEQTRQRILDAAYRLFRRQGFGRVSMDEIAAATRVTKRTLYYHFESKDQLLAHVLEAQHRLALAAFKTFGDRLSWPSPRGGFFLWATLPEPIEAERLLTRAVDHGVIYVSGDAFFVNGTGKNFVRLSFSAPTPDRIREGVRRLGSAVTEELVHC